MHANQGSLNHLISGWWHKQTPPPHLPTLSYKQKLIKGGWIISFDSNPTFFEIKLSPQNHTSDHHTHTWQMSNFILFWAIFSRLLWASDTFSRKSENSCGIITVWSTQKALHGQIWTNPQAENLIIACFISYLKQARNRHSKSKLQSKLDAANWQQHPSSCL